MKIFQNLNVLYIEEHCASREKNVALMRDIGLNVLETDNLDSTNDLLKHNKIDMILIDLDMHQKERMTFLKFLRYKEIVAPIIITADDSSKEILLDAINLDATRFLIKPLKEDELINAINNTIGKKLSPLPLVLIANELHNGFSYDPINKCFITANNEDVQLTKKEHLLIELFIKNKNKLVTFGEIESAVWVDSVMSDAALRTLIHEIRKKSYDDIVTSYSGIGYKMSV
ncbi:MAG: response regulator [Sulfuricurvum sp.]|nr:response regulator [Sulfuricurvum sp.]